MPEETSLLDASNLRRGQAALPSVEELAALYVQAIREDQPRGPYRLLGISFGGVLAYEAAAMQERGSVVTTDGVQMMTTDELKRKLGQSR